MPTEVRVTVNMRAGDDSSGLILTRSDGKIFPAWTHTGPAPRNAHAIFIEGGSFSATLDDTERKLTADGNVYTLQPTGNAQWVDKP